jgi:flagellin-like hook-associated protein FlgL
MSLFSYNIPSLTAYNNSQKASYATSLNMQHLSSGSKLLFPGEAPSDFALASQYSYELFNTDQGIDNIQNSINLMNTSDAWLQQVQSMLDRMGELAISSVDAAKSNSDIETINTEFQQLKEGIAQIAQTAHYNKVLVAGRDQLLTYNNLKETFVFSRIDGEESYELLYPFTSGVESSNGLDLKFNPQNDYTLSPDGSYILYVNEDNALSRYEIETATLTVNESTGDDAKTLKIGNDGSVWFGSQDEGDEWSIHKMNLNTWLEDSDWVAANQINNLINGEFSYYEEHFFYAATNSIDPERTDLLKVNAFDKSDITFLNTREQSYQFSLGVGEGVLENYSGDLTLHPIVPGSVKISAGALEITDDGEGKLTVEGSQVGSIDYETGSYGFDVSAGEGVDLVMDYEYYLFNLDSYVISADGQYLAEVIEGKSSYDNTLRATNIISGNSSSIAFEEDAVLSNMKITPDSTSILVVDETRNSIRSVDLVKGVDPVLVNEQTVETALGATVDGELVFEGISVGGSSNRSALTVQFGGNYNQYSKVLMGDARLVTLGLSEVNIENIESGKVAIGRVSNALNIVGLQRATLGGEASRFMFTLSSQTEYRDNIGLTEGMLRDVDMAKESAEITSNKLWYQSSLNMIAEANMLSESLLQLLMKR